VYKVETVRRHYRIFAQRDDEGISRLVQCPDTLKASDSSRSGRLSVGNTDL
jgi:hypothetical protein